MRVDSMLNRSKSVLRLLARVGAIVAASALLIITIFAGRWLYSDSEFRRSHDLARTIVLSLKHSCPDAWESDWVYAIDMTSNGIANCFGMLPREDWNQFRVFVAELGRRSQQRVTWDLVDWIWCEIERFGVNGKQYSAKWRPRPTGT